jgi:hypothetical protein
VRHSLEQLDHAVAELRDSVGEMVRDVEATAEGDDEDRDDA